MFRLPSSGYGLIGSTVIKKFWAAKSNLCARVIEVFSLDQEILRRSSFAGSLIGNVRFWSDRILDYAIVYCAMNADTTIVEKFVV